MHEIHNTSISAILNSFYNITAVRSVSVMFVFCTEAIMCSAQILTLRGCEEKWGTKGFKLSAMMQVL